MVLKRFVIQLPSRNLLSTDYLLDERFRETFTPLHFRAKDKARTDQARKVTLRRIAALTLKERLEISFDSIVPEQGPHGFGEGCLSGCGWPVDEEELLFSGGAGE